jgi:hypothetical protein
MEKTMENNLFDYYQNGIRIYQRIKDQKVVACATSTDGFENQVNYFCLPDFWEQNANTAWVNEQELFSLINS